MVSVAISDYKLTLGEASTLWIRGLSGANETSRPNLISNPGFEKGLSGWRRSTNDGLAVRVVQVPAHNGDKALEFSSDSDLVDFCRLCQRPGPGGAGAALPGKRLVEEQGGLPLDALWDPAEPLHGALSQAQKGNGALSLVAR